jgi:hypothetical protein
VLGLGEPAEPYRALYNELDESAKPLVSGILSSTGQVAHASACGVPSNRSGRALVPDSGEKPQTQVSENLDFVIPSEARNPSFLRFNPGEIPRFARNDRFSGLFSATL